MKHPAVFFILFAVLSCTTNVKEEASVMFRGNAAHTALYSATAIDTLQGKKWKNKVEGKVFSSPAIYKGIAYIGTSEKFYAMHAETGDVVWSITVDGPAHSSPAVDKDVVYFSDFSGEFYALNIADGSVQWTFLQMENDSLELKDCTGWSRKINI